MSEDKDTEGYPAFEPTGTDATSREEFYRISEGSGEVSMKRVTKVDTLLRGYMSGSMKRGMSMQARASACLVAGKRRPRAQDIPRAST
ncbi:MAG: hypothetical protein LKE92_06215 [Atopobiaceae bacterium]|nr:hypothetical protein [Atopobiaceae bacterium]